MLSELMRPGSGSGGQDNLFFVSLTPTAPDYSGDMDHTVAEILQAFQDGKEVWFKLQQDQGYVYARCTMLWDAGDYNFPSFNAFVIDNDNDLLIMAWTGAQMDGTYNSYNTTLYTMNRLFTGIGTT